MIAAPGLVTAIPEQTPLSHQPSKGLSGKAAAAHAARKPSEPRTQGASIAALLMRPRTPDRAGLQPAGAPDDFLDRPFIAGRRSSARAARAVPGGETAAPCRRIRRS